MEPLEKPLSPGIRVRLEEDGALALLAVTDGTPTQVFYLSAEGVRSLLNFLRRRDSRKRIKYRLWR